MTALISLPAYPACNLRQTHLHLAKGGRRQKHPELYCERSYHVPCQAGWRNWAGYVRDYLWPFLIKKLSERLLCSCWGRQPAQRCRARVLMLGLFHFPFVFLRHCAPMCPCTSASWAVFFFVPCRLSCPLLLPPKEDLPSCSVLLPFLIGSLLKPHGTVRQGYAFFHLDATMGQPTSLGR